MLNAFWWLITAEAVGLAAFPLAYFLFPRLKDRGYSVSKPLGILFVAYASWILSVLHILPSVRITIIALLLVMGVASAWYAYRHRRDMLDFVRAEWRAIAVAEAVFLAFFIGWTIFRAFDPFINHTEQPMDFAFLNAVINSQFGSPEDPWLRGESVSYYYFGYWMMGSLSQLTGVASQVSFNLSLALIPAMSAMGLFGIVYNLVRSDAGRRSYAYAAGIAAALLMGIVANLVGVLEFMRANGIGSAGFWDWVRIDGLSSTLPTIAESWRPEEFWWWFRSTRVINTFDGDVGIDYTIQEFPFFSFILGDLHPHVMAIPFAVLFMAFAFNFLKSPMHEWRNLNPRTYIPLFVTGLALGGLAFTNMWDFPTYATLFLGIAALKTYRARGGGLSTLARGVIPVGALVIGTAVLLFLPYYLTFRAGVTGIGAVETTTRSVHFLLIWSLFFVAVTPFLLATFWRSTVGEDWRRVSIFALLIAFSPWLVWAVVSLFGGGGLGDVIGRFFKILPLALLIAIGVYNAMWLMKKEGPSGRLFATVLAVLGMFLILGPELLYIRDSFDSRMNTIFKLYYQSWILLAAASGFAIYYWRSLRISLLGWRRSLTTLWAAAFAFLLLGSLYYPPAAGVSKSELTLESATLDGLSFLRRDPRMEAEHAAINFIKENVDKDSAVLEAVGEWSDWGLVSRSTGVPTILNWPGHEMQWRGGSESFEGRESDVELIYMTTDGVLAKNLLAKYDVDYVYVGPREREKYGLEGLDKFESFMEPVFNRDDVTIYRLKQQ